MEFDQDAIVEIKQFANNTGTHCIIHHAQTNQIEYELNPAGHISFVYDERHDGKPTCYLFEIISEHSGGAMRRIVLTSVKKETDKLYKVCGYMGNAETPVQVSIIPLDSDDEALVKANWAEWLTSSRNQSYPEQFNWKEI